MKDRARFIKSGILLTAVALLIRSVGMLFGAFISREVGAEGTGLYTVVTTVYSFAITLATSGISLTVTRLVASLVGESREGELNGVLRSSVAYALIFATLASLLLFFGADLVGETILRDARTVSSLRILSLSLVPIALGSVFSGYFVGVKRVGFNAAVQVLAQLVKVVVTVVLVLRASERGVTASVYALSLGITITETVGFLLLFLEFLIDRRLHGKRKVCDGKSSLREVASTALPLAFSAYVRSVLLNIEHILIPRKLMERGESASESYSHYGSLHGMALPMILYPMTVLSSFSGLLVPEFAENMAAGKERRMSRIASVSLNSALCFAVISAVLLYGFSEELGYAVYTSYDAGRYIALLAPVIPIMYLDHVTDQMLKGIGEQVFSMWINITDSMISVLLVWFLIPRMGISGYAVVIVVMEGYNFLFSWLRLKKRVRFSVSLTAAVLIPLSASVAAILISHRLFPFAGKSVGTLWLVLKLIFAVSITVAFRAVFMLAARKISEKIRKNQKCKREIREMSN